MYIIYIHIYNIQYLVYSVYSIICYLYASITLMNVMMKLTRRHKSEE